MLHVGAVQMTPQDIRPKRMDSTACGNRPRGMDLSLCANSSGIVGVKSRVVAGFKQAWVFWVLWLGVSSALPDADASPPEAHWAFRSPVAGALPSVQQGRWCHNPIDRFILAGLEAHGLRPQVPAQKRTLIRRVYLDLLGLPPTPAQVERFLSDPRSNAYEALVDELLASPHYGERWGRWWLDLARYADSNGQDENKFMANAWRYRDWVIRSLNADLPFSDFLTQQIAGDLLPEVGSSQREIFDRWTATGLLVLGPKMLAEQDKPKLVMDLVDEQIDTVSRAFLGLTVSCARCHDHKFDPIPTRDYYALAGIFKSTRSMADLAFVSKWNERSINTREELAGRAEFIAATNRISAALSDRNREADAQLASQWRERSKDYAQIAWSLTHTSSIPLGTQRVASIAREARLHAETLQRWTAHLERERKRSVLTELQWSDLIRSLPGLAHDLAGAPAASGPVMAWADGKIGSGFAALGANYLEVPHDPSLEPPQLTLELWVRPESLPGGDEPRRWIASKNASEWADGHYGLILQGNRAGAYLNIGGGASNVFLALSEKGVMEARRWTHLAMTYDGRALRLFCKGEESASMEVNRPRTAGQGAFQIGRRVDGFRYFQGAVDEVHLFSRALSAKTLRSRAQASAAADLAQDSEASDSLVRAWSFVPQNSEEQQAVSRAELRALWYGEGGLLVPPAGARDYWATEHRAAVEALEIELASILAHPPVPEALCLAVEESKVVDLPVHLRGSHLALATNPIPRGFLPVLKTAERPTEPPKERSGRLELARWLCSPDHPLTARVTVNRLWQAHFGEGLMRSPDNFGLRGDAPSHPELLDWLAVEFVKRGWSLKQMHRLILGSSTYQQSSQSSDLAVLEKDPENRWLSRFPRQRLEGETIRDSLLLVSGRLDPVMGGSLVNWKNAEYVPGREQEPFDTLRRSIYLPVIRDRVYEVFTLFDFANPSLGCAQRKTTTVAHQALFFMNSPLVKESSRALAASLLSAPVVSTPERIVQAYERCLGRKPQLDEVHRAERFLDDASRLFSGTRASEQAWAGFCQTLVSSSEFVYRE